MNQTIQSETVATIRSLSCDPGLRNFGIAVVDLVDNRPIARSAKVWHTFADEDADRIGDDDAARVQELYLKLDQAVVTTEPDCMAFEFYTVYTTKATKHGWKVSMVTGAIIACAAQHGIPLYTFKPGDVKRRVGGRSDATKEDVMRNAELAIQDLTALLQSTNKSLRDHASDAAAIALMALKLHESKMVSK